MQDTNDLLYKFAKTYYSVGEFVYVIANKNPLGLVTLEPKSKKKKSTF